MSAASDHHADWAGRFPYNDIISLLDVNREFNLAESTSQDLTLDDLLCLPGVEDIGRLALGYGGSAGDRRLREAIAAATGVLSDQVITTQGTALGLFLLAFEVCRPGDDVILVTPCFPPARATLVAAEVHVRELALSFDSGYRLDLDALARMLTPATRLVSIASPQNPSGVQITREEIEQVLRLLTEYAPGALLYVDETYREAAYGSEPVLDSVAGLDPRIVTGASVSKALGAPGLRTGWLTVSDSNLRDRLVIAKMNIVISGSVLDEALATALIRNRDRVLAPRRALLATALSRVSDWCATERDRVEWVRPDAGALCCIRLRKDVFDEEAVARFWALLSEHRLQLASGEWFGETARSFRLGFGYLPAERLRPALQALTAALDAAIA